MRNLDNNLGSGIINMKQLERPPKPQNLTTQKSYSYPKDS